MSQENVETILRSMEAARRDGGMDAGAIPFHPDVEWDISRYPLPDFPDTGRGRDELAGHLTAYFSGWTDYESTVSEIHDHGDEVVVILKERVRMPGSETMLERELPQVWTIEDGTCRRFRVFKTRAEALRAAGIEG